MKKYFFAILSGILSAGLFAAIGFGGFLSSSGSVFSPLFIAILGLYFGLIPFIFGSLVGIVFLLILYSLVGISPFWSLGFLGIDVLPVFIGTYGVFKARNSKSLTIRSGKICSWIALYISFILAFIASCALAGNMREGIDTSFVEQIRLLVDAGFNRIAENFNSPDLALSLSKIIEPFSEKLSRLFLTTIGLTWLARSLLMLSIAYWIYNHKPDIMKLKIDYLNIKLENWLAILAILLIILGIVTGSDIGYIALNLGIILSSCFALTGFAVCYYLAIKSRHIKIYLTLLYILTIALIFTDIASIILMLFGLIESFVNIRFKNKEI